MGIIKRNYKYLDTESFTLLFESLMRLHLEYGDPTWNLWLKRYITELERAHKGINNQENKQSRLPAETLIPDPLLQESEGNMIETYKLLKNIWQLTAGSDYFRERKYNPQTQPQATQRKSQDHL